MGTDFSRIRLNPLLDYAGVELKQGACAARRRRQRAGRDRRPAPARAGERRARPRARSPSTTPDAFKITVAGRHAARSARGGSMSTGCSPRTTAPTSNDPAKRLFDPLLAEPQFADPIAYAAQPYLPNPPALPTAAAISSISTSGTARSPTSSSRTWSRARSASMPPRASRRSGRCGCSRRTPATATCASPDGDLPGWVDTHRALDRAC